LYSNQAKIAVLYVLLVDDLPGCYRISVPELFPIVPELFPQGTAYQTRRGGPIRGKKFICFWKKWNSSYYFLSAMDKNAGEKRKNAAYYV
jgi:hypothetical protein